MIIRAAENAENCADVCTTSLDVVGYVKPLSSQQLVIVPSHHIIISNNKGYEPSDPLPKFDPGDTIGHVHQLLNILSLCITAV